MLRLNLSSPNLRDLSVYSPVTRVVAYGIRGTLIADHLARATQLDHSNARRRGVSAAPQVRSAADRSQSAASDGRSRDHAGPLANARSRNDRSISAVVACDAVPD